MCQSLLDQAWLGAIKVTCLWSSAAAGKSVSQGRASILGLELGEVSNGGVKSSKLVLCFPGWQESLIDCG